MKMIKKFDVCFIKKKGVNRKTYGRFMIPKHEEFQGDRRYWHLSAFILELSVSASDYSAISNYPR